MNKIVHVNREPFDVYMGREWDRHPRSPWHNPFNVVYSEITRKIAIEKFAAYFYAPEQKWLRDKAFAEINPEAVLGCWCAPLKCHAEIVAGYLEWKRSPGYFDYVIDGVVEQAAEELGYRAGIDLKAKEIAQYDIE